MFADQVAQPTGDMIMIEICKYMGWSYDQVAHTPADIIEVVKARMMAENKASSKK